MTANENVVLTSLIAIVDQDLGAIKIEGIVETSLNIDGTVILYRAINGESFAPFLEIPYSIK